MEELESRAAPALGFRGLENFLPSPPALEGFVAG